MNHWEGGTELPFAAVLLGAFLASFLLGSIPFGVLVARALKIEGLREKGSGNIGATNVARVGGFWPAGALTLALDAAKGAIPPLLALHAGGAGASFAPLEATWVVWAAAFFAVLGHCYTPWLSFKGGKGVATGLGAICVLAPYCALAGLIGFALTFLATRTGSLSSLMGLVVASATCLVLQPPGLYLWAGAGLVAIIIFRHESNLDAVLADQERRF